MAKISEPLNKKLFVSFLRLTYKDIFYNVRKWKKLYKCFNDVQ